MNRRAILPILGLPLLLAGCGRSDRIRYKLTLAVETPDGIKSGFSVVEVHVFDIVSLLAKGIVAKAIGEAVYVDLGEYRRPLIAAMTLYRHKPRGMIWAEGKPQFRDLLRIYAEPQSKVDIFDDISRLKSHREKVDLTTDDMPDLVTFADKSDPKSVLAVDPHNLAAALGSDVSWHRMTLELTDEPVTEQIETFLPWLKVLDGHLDGERWHDKNTLANNLSRFNFKKAG